VDAGAEVGVRVISGCEFSVGVHWGEMHLLAYFLPYEDERLNLFIEHQQQMRIRRAGAIVQRLADIGVTIDLNDVFAKARGAAVGRPHVARVLVECGAAVDVSDAFRKFLAAKKPAFVPKKLPDLKDVTNLIRSLGGLTSAAHLRSRATRTTLIGLKAAGIDAVEVKHPAHNEVLERSISSLAIETGLFRTGGSDWHGDSSVQDSRAQLGNIEIPEEWLHALDRAHAERLATLSAA
jgi:predicted metal-dependent phosphoesterase TrpH